MVVNVKMGTCRCLDPISGNWVKETYCHDVAMLAIGVFVAHLYMFATVFGVITLKGYPSLPMWNCRARRHMCSLHSEQWVAGARHSKIPGSEKSGAAWGCDMDQPWAEGRGGDLPSNVYAEMCICIKFVSVYV